MCLPYVFLFQDWRLAIAPFSQEGEQLLQIGERLPLAGVRAFQRGAPLPLALDLGAPQAQQVSMVDVRFIIHRVSFAHPCFTIQLERAGIVRETCLSKVMW